MMHPVRRTRPVLVSPLACCLITPVALVGLLAATVRADDAAATRRVLTARAGALDERARPHPEIDLSLIHI